MKEPNVKTVLDEPSDPQVRKNLDDIAKYLEDQFRNTQAEGYNLDAIAVVLKNQLAANGYDPDSFHIEVEQETGNIYVVPNGRKFVDAAVEETVSFTIKELEKALTEACKDYVDKVLYERQIGHHSFTTAECYAKRVATLYFLKQRNMEDHNG